MKTLTVCLATLLVGGVCSPPGALVRGANPTRQGRESSDTSNQFALDLYARLRARPGNCFLSPYSLTTGLGMTHAGARGPTAQQMATVLHLSSDPREANSTLPGLSREPGQLGQTRGCQVQVANALWGQQGLEFLPAFRQATRERYGADLAEVDFARSPDEACKTINAWVQKQTRNKIQGLVNPGLLDAQTRLVLTNAIYFKGTWSHPFKKRRTRKEAFHASAGRDVQTPLMHQDGTFGYLDGGSFQVLELPYADSDLAMVLFLPRQADGLTDFEKDLTSVNLSRWLARMRAAQVKVILPRFQIGAAYELKPILSAMGMPLAFDPTRADFSGVNVRKEPLFLKEVVHKAFVEVNEEGTEASAATGILARARSLVRASPEVFRADHAFVFLVRNRRSGSILFLGRLADPQPENGTAAAVRGG